MTCAAAQVESRPNRINRESYFFLDALYLSSWKW